MRIDLTIRDKASGKGVNVLLYPDCHRYCMVDMEGAMNDFMIHGGAPTHEIKSNVLDLVNHEISVEKESGLLFAEVATGVLLSAKFDLDSRSIDFI